eukprot:TRINITY_DN7704_c0_g1_i1.p1 TRINITY_DN7704_c0_g1~~TRINITY_DN7704_c0_g1_i1.p1  ORF type:complete len:338 (+),score=89.89 TRINITY_DN7704_c0_g1_i1:125-1138(+)
MSNDESELEREEERQRQLLRAIRELETKNGVLHKEDSSSRSATQRSDDPGESYKTCLNRSTTASTSSSTLVDNDLEELEIRKMALAEQLHNLSLSEDTNNKGIKQAEEVITNLEQENKSLKEALQKERDTLQREREAQQKEKDAKRRKLAELSRKLKQSETQLEEANKIIGSALTEIRIVAAQVPATVPSHVHKSVAHVEELLSATTEIDSEDEGEQDCYANDVISDASTQKLSLEMANRLNRLEHLNNELQKLSSERSTLHTRYSEVSSKKNAVLSAHPNTTDQRLKDIVLKVEGCAQAICQSMDRLAAKEAKIIREKEILDSELAALHLRRDRLT